MKQRSFVFSCASALLLAMVAVTNVQASELPVRKAGLWEVKATHEGGRSSSPMRQCTDAAFEKEMGGIMKKEGICQKQDIRKTATGYVIDSECKIMGMTTTSRAEITGDFNSSYKMKQTAQTQGGAGGKAGQDSSITIEGKWLGACPAGWKPGDMEVEGDRINLRDLK